MENSKAGIGTAPHPIKRGKGTASPYSFAPDPLGLNQNHVVCLPLVTDRQKLLWAYSDQIQELDNVAYLTEAFKAFPYPTLEETAALAQRSSMHLDQVRVWFMVQRLHVGISWEAEEISEARHKMYGSSQVQEIGEARHKMCGSSQVQEIGEARHKMCGSSQVQEIGEARHKMCGSSQVPKMDKNDKVSEMTRPLGGDGEGSGHSPVNTSAECGRVFSPAPCKRLKHHLVAGPNKVSLQPPSPLPQISPLPVHSVGPCTTMGQPLNVRVIDNYVRYHRPNKQSNSELWQSFLQDSKPSQVELRRLQALTNLNMKYIRKWFANRRFSFGVHHRVKANPESENGQSQPNSRRTQPAMPHHESGIRPTKKRASNADDIVTKCYNGNHDTPHQMNSSLEGKEVEKDLKVRNEKGLGSANDETPTRVRRCREIRENSQEDKGKEEQKDVGFANVRNNRGDTPPKMSGRTKVKTGAQLGLLRRFFLTCQWPNGDDYSLLQQETGLSRPYITKWFSDTRYHIKRGKEHWITKEDRLKVLAQIREKQKGQRSPCMLRH
uniref:Homeobox domain-containing protein n=1 Tax=Esox lucius TaxID=8010 RepID=A0AAY5KK58_ESOLU